MKLSTKTARFLLAAALFGLPLVSSAAEKALKEPVKSVLDHYLMIQTELAKDFPERSGGARQCHRKSSKG